MSILQWLGWPVPAAPPPPTIPAPADPALEGRVREKVPWLEIGVFGKKLSAVERQVCRIDLGGGTVGTGFLVGPDLVLTNHHVLKDVIAKRATPQEVTCWFDYRLLTNGATAAGVPIGLDSLWCLDTSPPTQAEMDNEVDGAPATDDELDYALIRLTRRIGEERLSPGGGHRGWVRVSARDPVFKAGMPLMIAQHPRGRAMKLAVDTEAVVEVRPNGTRVRYRTNTEHGSSGSPVFDMNWELVALHHLGEPATLVRFNQGIPVKKIRERLTRLGLVAFLEAPEPVGPPLPPPSDSNKALGQFRTAFALRRTWFDRLNAFKRLHEVLHNLLMRKPGLDDAVALYKADPPSARELVRVANAVDAELLREAISANALTGAPWKSEEWIASLSQAVSVLRTDALRANPVEFEKAIGTLSNLPRQKQSGLDRDIVQSAIQLAPEELAVLLDEIVASPDPLSHLVASPESLKDFRDECRRLAGLTADHALCQDVDNALAAMPAEDAARSRVPRWPDILALLHQIAARRPQDPLAVPMLTYARAFDEASDGQPAADAFLFLCDQFGFLFKQLDGGLLDATDRVVQKANVLSGQL